MLKCLLNPVLRKSLPISMTFSRAFSISKCLLANYYDVLKLNPNASQKEIKEAYYKLSKQNHPDLNPNDPKCHDRFIKLQEAYNVLSNPKSRKEYDMRSARSGPGSRQESYYHHDARRKPDFSARDEWIRQQNERMEREMKFGQHFGQRYDEPRDFNSFYSKPHNMTPEEMKLYMRRKKIAGTFNSMNFVVTCLVVFMFIIVSESFYVSKIRDKYYVENMRRNAEILRGYRDPYEDRSWEARSRLLKELEESELREASKDTQFDE